LAADHAAKSVLLASRRRPVQELLKSGLKTKRHITAKIDLSNYHRCEKKMFEHKESAGHKAALKLIAEAEKETPPNVLVKTLAREKGNNFENFSESNKVAKENQSSHNFETEIDLQELNGIYMERILHSADACTNIVNHISTEMRKALVNEIIGSKKI
jgi:hypothetical protein